MSYKSLRHAVADLEATKQLVRIPIELDPNLEIAELHRRVFEAQGPALLFERVKGSPFQAISNIYGTIERTRFLFRHSLQRVQKIVELKADPSNFFKNPLRYLNAPFIALNGLPSKAWFSKPILHGKTSIGQLPQIRSWPLDGGPFITLPQVFSMALDNKDIMKSNLGMYRIQLGGNDYKQDEEIGLHYQLHRGIGVHHSQYNKSDEPFRVSIFVGGPPSHAFSAIMPLPENLSELSFAGLLNNRRFRYFEQDGHILSADADFCIVGTIEKGRTMPEGPFGDHLGYYSLTHDFPVMKVEAVYHRKDPLWHFSVVGRPPQEDSSFGYLIHEIVRELTPGEFPGLVELNAVDASGVHPLLIAIGQERYMPFREQRPEEILTVANHLLGKGQTSLAKYLIIAAEGDNPKLDTHDIAGFFEHVLARIDWRRDLHFQTETTMDTLDYSGGAWNAGSKVVWAVCGPVLRELGREKPLNLRLPQQYNAAEYVLPGILALQGGEFQSQEQAAAEMEELSNYLAEQDLSGFPLVIVCDDAPFVAATLNNFLWRTFTRSNPSHDIYGVKSFSKHKHWGCEGSLIIDARRKQHHAPDLVVDAKVKAKIDSLLAKNGALGHLNL